MEELEKKNIISLLLQNGAGERRGLEELEKEKINSRIFQNGSGERRGFEELEKEKINSHLFQNGSGERRGLEKLDKISQVFSIVFFFMVQVRQCGFNELEKNVTSLLLQNLSDESRVVSVITNPRNYA